MTTTQDADESGTGVDPEFTVESDNDLAELLRRAGNWAERDVGADVIAEELRDGAAYVEHEIVTKEARADD
jgi:hypothetical protein